jgi:hypothetical protein
MGGKLEDMQLLLPLLGGLARDGVCRRGSTASLYIKASQVGDRIVTRLLHPGVHLAGACGIGPLRLYRVGSGLASEKRVRVGAGAGTGTGTEAGGHP